MARFLTLHGFLAEFARFGVRMLKSQGNAYLFETGWGIPFTLFAQIYDLGEGPEPRFDEYQCIAAEAFCEKISPPDNFNGRKNR